MTVAPLPVDDTRAALGRVPWLASLGDGALDEALALGSRSVFRAGQVLVAELELGDELFLILDGTARATVAAGRGAPIEIGVLHAGDACGELSLLTRALRSATVTAVGDVTALCLGRAALEDLIARYPQIAVHFARTIAAALADTDRALDALLAGAQPASPETARLTGHSAAIVPARGSFRRAWLELVTARRHDLPFLALTAFVLTLLAVRGAVWAVESLGGSLFALLRDGYVAGIVLVILSTATSLMRFRPSVRKAIAIGYGVGFALIVNELSVFLAFDVFYRDMTTPDPNMVLSVETLYRRRESHFAVALVLALLAQAAFLRGFYRRSAFILRTRLRALFGRRSRDS